MYYELKFMKRLNIILTIGLTTNLAQAITIRMLDPDLHDRFASNTPGATANGTFQYAGDFSGVGWATGTTSKSVTMISDTHFVSAVHHAIGSSVSFRDINGIVSTHTVSGTTVITNADNPLAGNSDLLVSTLSSAVSSDINFYPLLDPSLTPVGQDILIYGQNGRVGESTIVSHQDLTVGGIEGRTSISQYVIASGGPNDAFFTGGDSGGPSFIRGLSGELILSGVHWAVGSDEERDEDTDALITPAVNTFNIDTHVSDYINQINMVSGLTVTTSSNITEVVPEPSSSLILGMSSLVLLWRRKR